jgi:hypothetical protein
VATSSHGVAVTFTSTVVAALSPARSPNHYGGARSIIAASAAGAGSAMTRTSRRA